MGTWTLACRRSVFHRVSMPTPELRHLSREECFEHLVRERLGRVSVRIGEFPAILPVNYLLHNDDIVVRTAPGTKLSAASMGVLVGFEIDGASNDHRAGWSVLVVGHAAKIREPGPLEQVRRLPLEAWAPGDRDDYIRIPCEHVSGRAFDSHDGIVEG
jgi:nitroimidazol reductase NimA-like FMN-containing flavoprotein (pyridoxamine 5'-phosphate oxidase superfamily)